jgi:hypothetical protein
MEGHMGEIKLKRFRKAIWVAKTLALCAAVVATAIGINRGVEIAWDHIYAEYAEAYSWAEKKLTREVVVQEFVDPESVPTEMLIEQVAAEYRVPVILLKAMAMRESGHWNALNRVRHEPHLLKRFAKDMPIGLNEIEREMWAASHGILQVVWGWHYVECGLGEAPTKGKREDIRKQAETGEGFNWIRLHDPLTNLRCGAKVLRSRLDKYERYKDPMDKMYWALRAYNGDTEDPDTHVYAEDILKNKMLRLLVSEIKGKV